MRRDVFLEQPAIVVHRAGPQLRPLSYPGRRVIGELDLGPVGVDPLASEDLSLNQGQRLVRVALSLKGLLGVPPLAVWPDIAGLIPARRKLPDIACAETRLMCDGSASLDVRRALGLMALADGCF
jgi:hypothetical protein